MYQRTQKKWTGDVICGKWRPNCAWDFDKSEEWQQLLCLMDMSSTPRTVSHQWLYEALSKSIAFLTAGDYPPRTKALHTGMQMRLQKLLNELVVEGYLTCDDDTDDDDDDNIAIDRRVSPK